MECIHIFYREKLPLLVMEYHRDSSKRRERSILRKIVTIISGTPRCAYCGRPITKKPYVWKGKKFCSRECKKKYRESISKKRRKRRGIRLPRDTFEAIYWK